MKIKITKNVKASENGIDLIEFEEGQEIEVNEAMGILLIKSLESAEEILEEVVKEKPKKD